MTKPDEDQLALDAFFAAGRAAAPDPSEALLARILADAAEVQVSATAAADARRGRGPFGLWAGLLAALGGWPAVAGLASAAVAGFWIGAAQPDVASFVGLPVADATSTGNTGYDLSDLGLGGLALAGGF